MSHWYVIYTKPRQEKRALGNLSRQGYVCYLPIFPTEKIQRHTLLMTDEPLFPRYLFIQHDEGLTARSWSPIRSTKGVSRLVTFGTEPARVGELLIDLLKSREQALQDQPQRLFSPGDRVRLTEGAFAGIEGIYQIAEGERRAMVLVDLMSRTVPMCVSQASLRIAV